MLTLILKTIKLSQYVYNPGSKYTSARKPFRTFDVRIVGHRIAANTENKSIPQPEIMFPKCDELSEICFVDRSTRWRRSLFS